MVLRNNALKFTVKKPKKDIKKIIKQLTKSKDLSLLESGYINI